jgi:hypothetical protein
MQPQLRPSIAAMSRICKDIADAFCRSVAAAARHDMPYRHFYADNLLPEAVVEALAYLPIDVPPPAQFSGKRDEPSAVRYYVNADALRSFPLRDLAEALQSSPVVDAIAALSGAPLEGTSLRLEYAIDRDGFWLAPHTDLGVKKFTGLISLGDDETQADLGTDLYSGEGTPEKRAPFRRNGGLMFVPGAETWHGFEKRPIRGLRRSLILNYVGPQWRARDQLAFPDQPVALTQFAQ